MFVKLAFDSTRKYDNATLVNSVPSLTQNLDPRIASPSPLKRFCNPNIKKEGRIHNQPSNPRIGKNNRTAVDPIVREKTNYQMVRFNEHLLNLFQRRTISITILTDGCKQVLK